MNARPRRRRECLTALPGYRPSKQRSKVPGQNGRKFEHPAWQAACGVFGIWAFGRLDGAENGELTTESTENTEMLGEADFGVGRKLL